MFDLLQDPDQCVDEVTFKILSKKISKALFMMSYSTKKGGNPFLYSFAGTKPHILTREIKGFHLSEFKTAATNGKLYWWNPEFLLSLKSKDILTVITHETLHIIFNHVEQSIGKNPKVWNIAIDFAVNAIIEYDHRANGLPGSPWRKPVFGPNITLKRLLNYLDGQCSLVERGNSNGVFTDPSLYKNNVYDIYNQILAKWKEDPDKNKTQGELLGSLDSHMPNGLDPDQLAEDIINAQQTAEQMEAGSTPGYIKDIVNRLLHPKIDFLELIKQSLFNKTNQDGFKNNWKKPKRRGLSLGYYLPSRYTHKPRWLCLLDTSGSMSQKDITYGLSQLKSLGDDTDGIVVPCDAKVYWDKAKSINNSDELEKMDIIGGGGTVFNSFFSNYEEYFGNEFDAIIIITDGIVPKIPLYLRPPCECFWVITRKDQSFNSFGKVLYLR